LVAPGAVSEDPVAADSTVVEVGSTVVVEVGSTAAVEAGSMEEEVAGFTVGKVTTMNPSEGSIIKFDRAAG